MDDRVSVKVSFCGHNGFSIDSTVNFYCKKQLDVEVFEKGEDVKEY